MATNYEKHFGTPEKAAEQVVKCKEDIIDTVAHECGIEAAKKVGRVYEDITPERYLEWLQKETNE